ncbi:hypothetical protein ACFQ1I_10045 [Kitasatospora arboriphila]
MPKRASSRTHWWVRVYEGSTGKQWTPRSPRPAARMPERRIRGALAAEVRWTKIGTDAG